MGLSGSNCVAQPMSSQAGLSTAGSQLIVRSAGTPDEQEVAARAAYHIVLERLGMIAILYARVTTMRRPARSFVWSANWMLPETSPC